MVGPISSSHPHGYYSQINTGMPPQAQQHIHNFKHQLNQIHTACEEKQHLDIKKIAENFKQFDKELDQFLTELNKYDNRGFESGVRMQFEVAHHAFEDKLQDIPDTGETRMRELLYGDSANLMPFLEQLQKADIAKIGQYAKEFSQDLSNIFNIY